MGNAYKNAGMEIPFIRASLTFREVSGMQKSSADIKNQLLIVLPAAKVYLRADFRSEGWASQHGKIYCCET